MTMQYRKFLDRRLFKMPKDRVEMLEYVMAVLDEARGFAAMSTGGRDNITEAYEMLPELMEQTYRAGFADGEQHSSENDAYTRGQEADYLSHVQRLKSERDWSS